MSVLVLNDVFVNKGYNNEAAIKFGEKGTSAYFQVSERVYDKSSENNHKYINYDVKVFDPLVKRIKDMGLKEGSRIHMVGRIDEESWEDSETKKTRRKKVVILDKIDYGYLPKEAIENGNGGQNGGGGQNGYGNGGQNGNGYNGGQGANGNPNMGAMPQQQYGQMPPQYQQGAAPGYQQPMPQQGQMPQNFTGYENFGPNGNGGNPYFNQG